MPNYLLLEVPENIEVEMGVSGVGVFVEYNGGNTTVFSVQSHVLDGDGLYAKEGEMLDYSHEMVCVKSHPKISDAMGVMFGHQKTEDGDAELPAA